jgi:hypothetical protein
MKEEEDVRTSHLERLSRSCRMHDSGLPAFECRIFVPPISLLPWLADSLNLAVKLGRFVYGVFLFVCTGASKGNRLLGCGQLKSRAKIILVYLWHRWRAFSYTSTKVQPPPERSRFSKYR